jgi:hypothetical protein
MPKTGEKQGHRWKKGETGNPRGNWKHTPHRLTQTIRDLVTPAAPKIVQKIIAAADERNDPNAQKTFIQHLLPQQPKFVDPPIVGFPLVTNAREAVAEIAAVTQRMAQGELDVDSAHALVDKLKTFIVGYSAVELELEVAKAKLREGEGQ